MPRSLSSSLNTLRSDGGGFVPAPPAGSTCQFGAVRYTLGVAARSLAWTRCQGQAPTPYSEVSGNRTLTDAELKDLSQTLGNLRVVGNQGACGADKPLLTIAVRTSVGSVTFADSFYACSIKDKPLLESRAVDAAVVRPAPSRPRPRPRSNPT